MSTDCVATGQPGAVGERVSVIVTGVGVAGQVKNGVALVGLLMVPVVAVQENVGGTVPAVVIADSEMMLLTADSSADTDRPVIVAHSAVDPLTTTFPEPLPGWQVNVSDTGVVIPALTTNMAEPLHVNAPPTVVAFSVIVYPVPAGAPPIWNRIVLLFWTLTVPDCMKAVPAWVMFQEMLLMVTPGATCNSKPTVPTSSLPVDGGGEQANDVAVARAITRIPIRT